MSTTSPDTITPGKLKMRPKQHRSCVDGSLHSEGQEESTQSIQGCLSKRAWTYSGLTVWIFLIVQRLKGSQKELCSTCKLTATAMFQSSLPEVCWDCAMKCNGYLRKAHNKCPMTRHRMSKILSTLRCTFDPLRRQSQLQAHIFEKTMLFGIFMRYAVRAGRGWSADLLVAECEDLEHL